MPHKLLKVKLKRALVTGTLVVWLQHLLGCMVSLCWMLQILADNEKCCFARGAANQTIFYQPCEEISPAVHALSFLLESQLLFIKNRLLLVELLVFPNNTMRSSFGMQIAKSSRAWNTSRALVWRLQGYLIWFEVPCEQANNTFLCLTNFFCSLKKRQSLLLHCLFAWSNFPVVLNVGFLFLHNR